MKTSNALFALGCAGSITFAADGPKLTDARPAPITAATNTSARRFGRDPANSNDVFYTLGPDSNPRDGVPKGKFTEAKVIPSNVFPGTQHTYWVYVPAQYDPARPTALMIFNDGQAMMAEPGDVQAHHVLDNLIFRREIPVMLGVFINPGRRADQPEPTPRDWGDRNTNRPDEYNPPTDKYARVIVEELMPALRKEFRLSPDPELHGIMGASSGGCAAFSVAWFRPNEFRKVITFVGSFTDIRGEYIYPELVAKSEKKPIRIFMQDGRNDNRRPDNLKRDWFYQNVRLMNALQEKGYDLNYTWGIGNHGQKQGGAIFPEMMRWLWRDQPVSSDPNDLVERSFRHPAASLGVFENQRDIGVTKHAGSVQFDPAAGGTYTVAGGGANMWFTNDAFHFVWKQVSGDVTLAADISFLGDGGDPHRKACLLVRQNLEPDSPYADAALHGDGLTSLQYRAASNDRTYEIQSGVSGPKRLRIEKRGRYVSMSIAGSDGMLRAAGGSFRLDLAGPFYVGLGVCAHNNERLERAVFSRLELNESQSLAQQRLKLVSTLETVPLASKDRRVVWTTTNHIEAPNWSRDGASLVFNSRGRIYQIPTTGGEPKLIETAFATRCNNDHGISPDGTTLVVSDQSEGDRKSRLYTVPIQGGTPTLITPTGPSYWHGWSPDGRTLAYCAERNGEFDVYTIPVTGGQETRLTTAPGLDDGPDYSPDGAWIYFNSDRTGQMHIWKMRTDGTGQEQVTHDEVQNWFPHPSPDGKWLVFLSYEKEVEGHPENKDVTLRIMPLSGGKIEVLARLFGGQGTINVPSWSPDSRRVAFVSYQLAP